MNLRKLKDYIVPIIRSGVSIELVSPPGIGKSTFIHDVRNMLSETDGEQWGSATMFLATQTPPDLIGLQFKGHVTFEGNEFPISDPTAPTWFIMDDGRPVFACKRGIMFLDEFGQGQTDVKASAAELLLNKRIGKWRLPDGWVVIAASNRSDDRSGVTKSLDFVINRRVEIHVTPDVTAWTDWALAHGVSPRTVAFANQYPDVVFSGKIPDKQGPFCTPRSLVMYDRIMQAFEAAHGSATTTPEDLEVATGMIGPAAAAQMQAFTKLDMQAAKYEDIVAAPESAAVPESPDSRMLVCYNLAHRVVADTMGAVSTYVQRFPKEFAVTFMAAAIRRDMSLIRTPEVRAWAAKNASLMALLNGHKTA